MLTHEAAGDRGLRKGRKVVTEKQGGTAPSYGRAGRKISGSSRPTRAEPAPSQSLSGDAPLVLPGGPGRHVRGALRQEGREGAGKGLAPAPGSSALLGRAAAGTRPDWQEPAPSSSSLFFPPPRGGFQPSSSFLGEGVRV